MYVLAYSLYWGSLSCETCVDEHQPRSFAVIVAYTCCDSYYHIWVHLYPSTLPRFPYRHPSGQVDTYWAHWGRVPWRLASCTLVQWTLPTAHWVGCHWHVWDGVCVCLYMISTAEHNNCVLCMWGSLLWRMLYLALSAGIPTIAEICAYNYSCTSVTKCS
jgi:hypothetical protein